MTTSQYRATNHLHGDLPKRPFLSQKTNKKRNKWEKSESAMLNGMVLSAAPVLAKPARKPSKKLATGPGPTPTNQPKTLSCLELVKKKKFKIRKLFQMLWLTGFYSTEQMRFFKYCNR